MNHCEEQHQLKFSEIASVTHYFYNSE